ncbi:Ragulator complex protein LAMTOR3 [Cladochytrium replicatum]|nr:Ragulator complex protein LAMTOR3 [Cladochytrium replicatum]
MENLLESLLVNNEGLLAVVIADKDGSLFAKAISPLVSPHVVDPLLSTTFAFANDQASKLGLGKGGMIYTSFDNMELTQFSCPPLYITLVSSPASNSGIMMDVGSELKKVVAALAEKMHQ